jgi:site-specific DNA-methyltransferase (adenine-specific)
VLGLEPLPEWFVAHLAEIVDLAKDCLKPSGSMWINIGDTYFARWSSIREGGRQGLGGHARSRRRTPMGGFRQEKQLLLIPARFAIAMQERRWILRNDLIWYKPNVPPRPESDRLRLAHEHFFHFVKRPKEGRPKYYYDISQVESRANDVVTYMVRAGQDGHTATFPEELIRPRILSSSPPGGIVLDPFCGTGRSLAVAVAAGREAIGFDLLPQFVRAARENTDQPTSS